MTAKIKLNAASGGGSFSLQAPSSSANNRVMTLPDSADGTVLTTTNPKAGNIIQVVSTTKGDTASQGSLGQGEYWDLSSIFKVDITPASASNKILISGHVNFQHDGSEVFALALYRDGSLYTAANGNQTDIGNRMRAMSGGFSERSWDIVTCPINFLDTALGNTNQKSYSVGLTSSTGSDRTYYLNRPYTWTNSSQYFNWSSTITAMEVAA